MTKYQHATVDSYKIFYREAGPKTAPTILLLHGFPTSSHMFRDLIPALADRYHVVTPDLPGFGFSDVPDRKRFRYTFEHLTKVIDSFTQIHAGAVEEHNRVARREGTKGASVLRLGEQHGGSEQVAQFPNEIARLAFKVCKSLNCCAPARLA